MMVCTEPLPNVAQVDDEALKLVAGLGGEIGDRLLQALGGNLDGLVLALAHDLELDLGIHRPITPSFGPTSPPLLAQIPLGFALTVLSCPRSSAHLVLLSHRKPPALFAQIEVGRRRWPSGKRCASCGKLNLSRAMVAQRIMFNKQIGCSVKNLTFVSATPVLAS
jgi:hypothetical protein